MMVMELSAVLFACLLGAEAPEEKSEVFSLRVNSVDAKLRRIDVKESAYEVLWEEGKTSFCHHRSILLKDLPEATRVLIHGKLRDRGGPGPGGNSGSLITDVDCIGTGEKFSRPQLLAKVQGVSWERATLRGKPLFSAEVGRRQHRIAGNDKLAVYSVEPLAAQKLKGAKVQILGTSSKVIVERRGKPVELTRIVAREVHLVELNPDHEKLFRLAWIEKKQDSSTIEAANEWDRKKAKGEERPQEQEGRQRAPRAQIP